jgi:hypothetical protein
VFEGQIARPRTATFVETVTRRNASLSFSVDLQEGHYDTVSSVEEKERLNSQRHIATDGQSVSKSWCRAPSGAHDQIFTTV